MRIIVLLVVTLMTSTFARRVNFEQEMQDLATKITANVKTAEGSAKSMVILPLNDSRAPGLGALVEQYLTVPLVQQNKVQVVDRTQLATMMQEAELQAMMSDSPSEVGKIASANYMLTGTISSGFDKNYLITLRLVSVESSRVVGAVTTEIPQSELDKRVRRN